MREFCSWMLMVAVVGFLAAPLQGQDSYATRSAEQWRRELAGSKYEVLRRRAAYVLGRLDGGKPSAHTAANAGALAAALKDRDLVVRWYAADSLGRVGAVEEAVLERMVAGLTDPTNDKDVRRNLAKSLGRIGKATPKTLEQLEAAVSDDDKLYALASAAALARLGRLEMGFNKLLGLAEDDDAIVAFAALQSLERLGGVRQPDAARLAKLLRHEATDVRRAAARLLGLQGWSAAPAVLKALADGAPPTSCFAALSYASAPQPSQQALQAQAIMAALPHLGDKQAKVQRAAAGFLTKQKTALALPLLRYWERQNDEWRTLAAPAVERWLRSLDLRSPLDWGGQRDELVATLLRLLQLPDGRTHRLTLWLLAELPLQLKQQDLGAALDTIRESLRDADVFNRRNAASILTALPNSDPLNNDPPDDATDGAATENKQQ